MVISVKNYLFSIILGLMEMIYINTFWVELWSEFYRFVVIILKMTKCLLLLTKYIKPANKKSSVF